MGIHGLLPLVKSIMSPIHIKNLRGQTVAVDTYSWLHKGALSCSRELCKGLSSSRHIDYCMHRVNMLVYYGVKPLLVFDGGLLPMKADQETKRSRARKENLERAIEHELAGNSTAAYECYQKAVDISPSVASDLIQVLKRENVDYIVAPYEADAQMTFLSLHKLVDAVITEDSDLIPFGCSRIIFKMDKFGQGVEFCSSKLTQNKELNLFGFTKQMILEMCILSGCDYLQSLPGMGLKRAHALIQNFKSYDRVIRHLRYNTTSVPPLYEESFQRALWTFLHQRVYDPRIEDIVHLTEIPEDLALDWDFLGPWLPQDVVKGIANGNLDPITKIPFEKSMMYTVPNDKACSSKEFEQTIERRRLHLPVQKNILTNYFCLTTIEAKRKFKAPQNKLKNLGAVQETSATNLPVSDSCTPKKEDVSCSINGSCSSSAESENVIDCKSSSNFIEDECGNKIEKITDKSSHENTKCAERPCLLVQNNKLCVPVLASHKEQDNACTDIALSNEKLGKRRFIRFGLCKKSSCENNVNTHCGNQMMDKGDSGDIVHDVSLPKTSIKSNNHKITTGKRKISNNHNENVQEGHKLVKHPKTDLPGKGGNMHCDISHLDHYSGIAEESMKRFVSVISTYRYTTRGSHVSGLRAPLKNIENTSLNR